MRYCSIDWEHSGHRRDCSGQLKMRSNSRTNAGIVPVQTKRHSKQNSCEHFGMTVRSTTGWRHMLQLFSLSTLCSPSPSSVAISRSPNLAGVSSSSILTRLAVGGIDIKEALHCNGALKRVKSETWKALCQQRSDLCLLLRSSLQNHYRFNRYFWVFRRLQIMYYLVRLVESNLYIAQIDYNVYRILDYKKANGINASSVQMYDSRSWWVSSVHEWKQ